jgi:tetratricopeptide (TPR) repeat protein
MDELREKGNSEFKQCNFKKAYNYYTKAIDTAFESLNLNGIDKNPEESIETISFIKSNECLQKCYNNRSQCNLKLSNFEEALEDANKVLIAVPDDTKALFRRCQAYKELNKLEEAMRDTRRLISIDPKNKQFIDFIQSLTRLIQDKVTLHFSSFFYYKSYQL